jgi:hypothetical protein
MLTLALTKIMNIYKRLGAKTVSLANMWNAKPPFIGEDGNPCEETVKWALNKQGFVDTDNIKFDSCCWLKDNSAVVPATATRNEETIYLQPSLSGILGEFYAECCRVDSQEIIIGPYQPHQIEKAFDDCIKKAQDVLEYIKSKCIYTKGANLDKRFTFLHDDGWYCDGIKVVFLPVSFNCLPAIKGFFYLPQE